MAFATERERRQTAGNRLKRLLDQQDDQEDEFYGTAYGGFVDEEEDNDYHSEVSEEDVVDSDFDQEDEEQQQQQQEGEDNPEQTDTNRKRKNNDNSDEEGSTTHKRKKVVYQAQSLQQELKAQKKEEAGEDSKLTRQQQKKANAPKTEAKTLRNSTSAKRFELEKRQKERQERRVYLKGVASLRNTREVRKLTQEELFEEAKITEEINLAALEAYQQIELKKKEVKRMKLTQECPRICTSSMTIVNEPKLNDNDQWNDLLDESVHLESERCSRTFVSFTHIQTFNETFAKTNSLNHHHRHRRLCPITGMPAQYFDSLTQMPYATLEAFKILRRIYAEEMKKQKRTASVLIDAHRDVNLNILR